MRVSVNLSQLAAALAAHPAPATATLDVYSILEPPPAPPPEPPVGISYVDLPDGDRVYCVRVPHSALASGVFAAQGRTVTVPVTRNSAGGLEGFSAVYSPG